MFGLTRKNAEDLCKMLAYLTEHRTDAAHNRAVKTALRSLANDMRNKLPDILCEKRKTGTPGATEDLNRLHSSECVWDVERQKFVPRNRRSIG